MNIVAHNLSAVNAQRQYQITSNRKAKMSEKLSSGYRINRAADDAAGLSISESMRRQIRGLTQGVRNTKDGISLCQVADGALAEVNDMLHRITELSVQAANGTNSLKQRQYIQDEINELITEIDRIGDETTFNQRKIFRGTDEVVRNADGSPMIEGNIDFTDFRLPDLTLGQHPFSENASANTLALQAIVDNPDLAANGKAYNMIYGNGNTSSSSIRVKYQNGGAEVCEQVLLSSLQSQNYTASDATGTPVWSRDFNYKKDDAGIDIVVRQEITIDDSGADEKKYKVKYSLINNGSTDVKTDFMFHVDTAYNNNDRCEGYFVNGQRVDNYCVYSQPGSVFTDGVNSSYIYDTGVPGSFSIVDTEKALAFSERITLTGNNKPDSVSIGYYYAIDDWEYYDNLPSNLGVNAYQQDLGFSLMWNFELGANQSQDVGFDYGIVAVEQDANLAGVPVNKSTESVTNHEDQLTLWIQSGCEEDSGMWLEIDEMDAEILGIRGLDVTTVQGAKNALRSVKHALSKVVTNRSKIGAQQNGLEHTIANEDNIIENTIAAESRIRDTDMATEMVQFANHNILEQAGQAMMSQANKRNEGILSLLQ